MVLSYDGCTEYCCRTMPVCCFDAAPLLHRLCLVVVVLCCADYAVAELYLRTVARCSLLDGVAACTYLLLCYPAVLSKRWESYLYSPQQQLWTDLLHGTYICTLLYY